MFENTATKSIQSLHKTKTGWLLMILTNLVWD